MVALLLIVLGVALRILPHMPNVAPIAAIALFGAVYLKHRHALVLPLTALVVSDLLIGFDSLESRLTVYGAFLLIGLIGLMIRKKKNAYTIAAGSISGSLIFYLITNFVYFHPPTMYPHTMSGQLMSYYNALPFFRNTLIGDLFYAGLLFGAYELVLFLSSRQREITAPSLS